MKIKLIQVVALDDRDFIRQYADFDPKHYQFEENINNYIHKMLQDHNVRKLDLKKWYE